MLRHYQRFWTFLTIAAVTATGCHPTQPSYFFEDGDLSHYLDVATEIEYPDVETPKLDEVTGSHAPLTLENADSYDFWDLTLEEAVRITLANSKVMRELGGRVISSALDMIARETISGLKKTVYDPALMDSSYGANTGSPLTLTGVEAALSEFDARFDTSIFWEKNDRPQNANVGLGSFIRTNLDQELGRFNAGLTKHTPTGGEFSVRNSTIYDANNSPTRALRSDWNTNFEAAFNHPLLQGAGTQYNRIAGIHSFASYAAGNPNSIDGVVIARIHTDRVLADFEAGVRNMLREVEAEYWALHFAYRDLETKKLGRDSALQSWKTAKTKEDVGSGGAADEAQARAQYFFFRSEVETALTELFRTENRLRYLLGLAMADGRLIRPSDEPTTAHVAFEWNDIHCEALVRRVEVRKKKWDVKKRELELIASRNHLLPRLDAVGRYRWTGQGDQLIDETRSGLGPNDVGSNAFETLTGGRFQEWQLGLQLDIPIGFRRELAQVRHHQLLLAREKALLEDLELEVSHQLGDAIRDLDNYYKTSQTNFNRRVASEREVQAVNELYQAGTREGTIDLLLDAQRRRADAETAYYRSLVDYNRAIMFVHSRKGSLLEYNGVYLAEGPWAGKAYFDASGRARKRDASQYLDYGFTRPDVFSRGPVVQQDHPTEEVLQYGVPTEATPLELPPPELVPEQPVEQLPEPTATTAAPKHGKSTDSFGPKLVAASGVATARPSSGKRKTVVQAEGWSDAAHRQRATQAGSWSRAGKSASSRSVRSKSHAAATKKTATEKSSEKAHESVANHTSSASSPAATSRKGTQRKFAGSGVRR